MKVLHISTSDRNGGAAIAAFRLNKAMNNCGIDSKMLVADALCTSENVVSLTDIKGKYFKFHRQLLYGLSYYLKKHLLHSIGTFSIGLCHTYHISKLPIVQEADVIYIHWVYNYFLGIKELHRLFSLGKPIIFFMHDMWLITGGCQHSFSCKKYQSQCSDCPNIQNNLFKDIVCFIFRKKMISLTGFTNLRIITPSLWLTGCVEKSTLFKKTKSYTIPNLLDTRLFKPFDKSIAKNIFNLSSKKTYLLFGADGGSNNPYKGWSYLQEALGKLKIQNVEIILLGNKLSSCEQKALPYPVRSVGYLTDEYALILLYNAVDVFITPSLAEAFGQTIIEAQACGTLVVGFDIGGIPGIIEHCKTGYLAKYRDCDDLAEGIKWALRNCKDEYISTDLHKSVEQNFSYQVVVNKHASILKTIL